MNDSQKPQFIKIASSPSDHMANERTFLAWIRTSIGIMAFGFVIEKFSLFVHQFNDFLALTSGANAAVIGTQSPTIYNYSSIFGVILVIFAVIVCFLAFIKYKTVERHLLNNDYHPTLLLNAMLACSVLFIGIFLLIFIIHNI